jgi:hypothetical protein
MNKLTIAAAALAAALLVQTQGFTQVPIGASTANHSGTTSDPEKEARKTWHAVMKNIPLPGRGCFHARYPEVAWESVGCKEAKPRARLPSVNRMVRAPGAGGGNDWVAGSTEGLIYEAAGKFFISGVTSETGVPGNGDGVAGGAILGPNEYSLQLNTNQAYTPTCNGNGNCTAWQQFIYATDAFGAGTAGVYMQYWLYDVNNCPSGWWRSPTSTQLNCYTNSQGATAPDLPVTDLGNVILEGWATQPGQSGLGDCVILDYGNEWFSAICADTVLDIGSVWTQAEFNVVGDLGLSEAQFNPGSQITVQLGIENGSENPYPPGGPAAVVCLLSTGSGTPSFPGASTTGETNNLNLGTCQTGLGAVVNSSVIEPYIEFTENYPVPSTPCLTCGGGGNPRPPTPPIKE